jgi:hypothetical protein
VKCQTNVSFEATVGIDVNLENSFQFCQSLRTFSVIVSNNDPKISGKMSFTIENKLITLEYIFRGVGNQ